MRFNKPSWISCGVILILILFFLLGFVGHVSAAKKNTISFNTATVEELLKIEDIDLPEFLAKSIVDYRKKNGRYKDPLDLRKVPGMTDYFFEELNPVMNDDETDVIYDPDAEPALAPSKC